MNLIVRAWKPLKHSMHLVADNDNNNYETALLYDRDKLCGEHFIKN